MASTLGIPCLAAPFRDLDFESPIVAGLTGSTVKTAYAVPGWTVRLGEQVQVNMYYNNQTLDAACASLFSQGGPPVIGKYTFLMKAGLIGGFPPDVVFGEASLSQVGDVPMSARSLQFSALINDRDQFDVSLGGHLEPVLELASGLWGVDVTAYAGMTLELRFRMNPDPVYPGDGLAVVLDNIHFSPDPISSVPEPSAWALAGVGAGVLLWSGRRR